MVFSRIYINITQFGFSHQTWGLDHKLFAFNHPTVELNLKSWDFHFSHLSAQHFESSTKYGNVFKPTWRWLRRGTAPARLGLRRGRNCTIDRQVIVDVYQYCYPATVWMFGPLKWRFPWMGVPQIIENCVAFSYWKPWWVGDPQLRDQDVFVLLPSILYGCVWKWANIYPLLFCMFVCKN